MGHRTRRPPRGPHSRGTLNPGGFSRRVEWAFDPDGRDQSIQDMQNEDRRFGIRALPRADDFRITISKARLDSVKERAAADMNPSANTYVIA